MWVMQLDQTLYYATYSTCDKQHNNGSYPNNERLNLTALLRGTWMELFRRIFGMSVCSGVPNDACKFFVAVEYNTLVLQHSAFWLISAPASHFSLGQMSPKTKNFFYLIGQLLANSPTKFNFHPDLSHFNQSGMKDESFIQLDEN